MMIYLGHRAHHLYNVIRYLCRNDEAKCTASRQLLARMLGDSPRSTRLVTDAISVLKRAKLINVEERAKSVHVITLPCDHEDRYTELLTDVLKDARKETERERRETTACALEMLTIERNREIIEEVDEDFKDEDFELDE